MNKHMRVAQELIDEVFRHLELRRKYDGNDSDNALRAEVLYGELLEYTAVPAREMRYSIADFSDGKRLYVSGPVDFVIDTDDVDVVEVFRSAAKMLALLDVAYRYGAAKDWLDKSLTQKALLRAAGESDG